MPVPYRVAGYIAGLVASLGTATSVRAQEVGTVAASLPALAPRKVVPFDIGEKLTRKPPTSSSVRRWKSSGRRTFAVARRGTRGSP